VEKWAIINTKREENYNYLALVESSQCCCTLTARQNYLLAINTERERRFKMVEVINLRG
jgi:hypothetical protein